MAKTKFRFILQVTAGLMLSAIPIIHAPFGWFETLFHELSHGLMALITGGSIESIALYYDGSGLCTISGGIEFLILLSGYAGSACWGLLITTTTSMTKAHSAKIIAMILAISVAIVAMLWIRDIVSLSILLAIIAVFFTAFRYGSHQLTQWFIEFIGIYVVMDAIRSPLYLLDGKSIGDGSALSKMTHIPEIIWILIWFIFAIAILIRLYHRTDSSPRKI